MAYVASGRFDGYFQNNLNLWDIAAGIVIVKESGGIVNQIDLLKNEVRFEAMSKLHNPYGDGKASERIVEFILKEIKL